MEQCAVMIKECLDGSERHENLYKSPTKRSFLNECIRQIYIMKNRGNELRISPRPSRFNRTRIWRKLNLLVRAADQSVFEASVQRVKRKLFLDLRPRTVRKQQGPRKRCSQQFERLYFKCIRYKVGVRSIRRNYLAEARQIVGQELKQGYQLSRHECVAGSDCDEEYTLNINTAGREFYISHNPFASICQHHSKIALQQSSHDESQAGRIQYSRNSVESQFNRRVNKLEEFLRDRQYRERQHLNDKVMEETVRSIYYVKALLGLMLDYEQTLYY